jgi:hypothetical protein
MKRIVCIISLVAGLGFFAGTANAQTVEELKKELAGKNAEIARLKERVQQLEASGAAPVHAMAPQPTFVPPPPPGPADEDVDRALEQTLVREGALVLFPFTYEVTPSFSWAHWDKVQEPSIDNSYSVGAAFRMGLPWRSQLSIGVPYVVNDLRDGDTSSGLGDAGVLFSKELLQETDTLPAVLGSVGWTSPTSRSCCFGPIPWVSGFQGGLTASKRLDPLVAFAGVSYFSSISREVAGTRVDPSDVIGTRLGASLAVTPATSITTGVHISFLTNPTPENLPVPNSDSVLSSVDIGFSTILWQQTLLSTTAQFGLTGDVPDFRLITSVPVRF